MKTKDIVYIVGNAELLLPDGQGHNIKSLNQIEFHFNDDCPIAIAERFLYRGLGGSIHYLPHLLMHPTMLERCKKQEFSTWRFVPLEQNTGYKVLNELYQGKIAGMFWYTRDNSFSRAQYPYGIAVIASEEAPSDRTIYVVNRGWNDERVPTQSEIEGLTSSEYFGGDFIPAYNPFTLRNSAERDYSNEPTVRDPEDPHFGYVLPLSEHALSEYRDKDSDHGYFVLHLHEPHVEYEIQYDLVGDNIEGFKKVLAADIVRKGK